MRLRTRLTYVACAAAIAVGLGSCDNGGGPIDYTGPTSGWSFYGGNEGGTRTSPLTQITPENVGRLKVAWTYRLGEFQSKSQHPLEAIEATPIIAEGKLYVCSNTSKIAALNPETGAEVWTYDPNIDGTGYWLHNCRGVSYYHDRQAASGAACASRIIAGTLDGRLTALDAATGKPCEDFGEHGQVDLKKDLGSVNPGEYSLPSPPVIIGDRIVTGAGVLDNTRADIAAGVIRAFNARTGALEWAWNPLMPGKTDADLAPPGEKYARGTTNSWSVLSADSERGLIFIPTGNTSPDHYGGLRNGLDYYSSSVVALKAETGEVAWHFQTVHHDLWDYDVPAQPVLFDFPVDGGTKPAVAVATKQGNIYILNRETGEPLVPVEERPAPQGALPGDTVSPTQPFPANPAYVLHPGKLTEDDMWGFTFWDRNKCREEFRKYRNDGLYTPPSTQGSILFPYTNGIMNWGSVSVDPARNILVVNTSRILSQITMVPREEAEAQMAKGAFFQQAKGTPYAVFNLPILSPLGAPCNPPPWGTLTAIDLKAGKRLWDITLGTTRDVAPFPIWLPLGSPSLGGPVTTASGVTFIAATMDNFIRAFDTATGKKLWQARLPAGGQATPMTYRLREDGKQYVVIAAGGSKFLRTKTGDYLIAYALPD
jgi:quinoprotein glucose dehydrogenase